MRKGLSFIVGAGFAVLVGHVSNHASAAWGLKFEVWDGANWVSSIWGTPGDVVKFRFGVYFEPDAAPIIMTADGTGTAQAMHRFTGSIRATDFLAGDRFQNVVRTIAEGGPALTEISGGTIGTSDSTSFGSQSFPDAVPFQSYTEIYRGEIKLATVAVTRMIEIKNKSFGLVNSPGLTFFNSASPVNKQTGAPQSAGPSREDWIASIRMDGPPCPSDFNGDLRVNDEDFALFVVAYQYLLCSDPAMPARCPADLNGDELVDDSDFQIFVQAYNKLECF